MEKEIMSYVSHGIYLSPFFVVVTGMSSCLLAMPTIPLGRVRRRLESFWPSQLIYQAANSTTWIKIVTRYNAFTVNIFL